MSELTTDIAAAKDEPVTLALGEESFVIERKPNMLLLSELARTDSGDPEALGVIAEFFEYTLGSHYKAFKRAFYSSADADDPEAIGRLIGQVVEATMGRPTE